MSCEHANTTTVAWCYGEGPEAHELHVAGCPDCTAVVDDIELVTGSLRPVAAALAAPAPRRPWGVFAAAAVAAVALVGLGMGLLGQGERATEVAPSPVPVAVAVDAPTDDFVNLRLDALDLELEALNADPSLL